MKRAITSTPESKLLPAAASYPWQVSPWERITARLDHLPHALMLRGAPGLGKLGFAIRLVYRLLCSNPVRQDACGHCKNCELMSSGNHPDLLVIKPEEQGKTIGIDQIRSISAFLHLRPHIANRKIALIYPAESMYINASNGLLKILEEPPLAATIILVSHNPEILPATVRSRCMMVSFATPDRHRALNWLELECGRQQAEFALNLAAGAPLLAQELMTSDFINQREQLFGDIEQLSLGSNGISDCAIRWKKLGTGRCLHWFQCLICDLIRLASEACSVEGLANSDRSHQLKALAERLHLKKLYGFLDTVNEARRLSYGPLDEQLLLEDILVRWHRLSRNQ